MHYCSTTYNEEEEEKNKNAFVLSKRKTFQLSELNRSTYLDIAGSSDVLKAVEARLPIRQAFLPPKEDDESGDFEVTLPPWRRPLNVDCSIGLKKKNK